MMMPKCLFRIAAACSAALVCATAGAQDYPSKPIRLIAGSPGGGVDFAARIIAQSMTGDVGQPVIVENRSSAGGTVAAQIVNKAAPDGYTLLFYGSPVWLAPYMRDNVDYDPLEDFAPITLAAVSYTHLTLPTICSV